MSQDRSFEEESSSDRELMFVKLEDERLIALDRMEFIQQ